MGVNFILEIMFNGMVVLCDIVIINIIYEIEILVGMYNF